MSSDVVALPHDDENEQAILGAVMMRGELLPICRDILHSPDAFYLERHQVLWSCFCELFDSERPIDYRTVPAWLEDHGKFEFVGGTAYVAGLDLLLPDVKRIDTYLAIAQQLWAKRKLVLHGHELISSAMNGNHPGEIIRAAEERLEEIERGQLEAEDGTPVGDICDLVDLDSPPVSGLIGINTGLADLNRLTQGWRPGQLIMIGGRPGMGKTSLAQQMMHDAKVEALMISLEMSKEELYLRSLAQISGVPHGFILSRRMSHDQRAKVSKAQSELLGSKMVVVDKPGLTMSAISSTARTHKMKHGLELVAIDYLGLVEDEGPRAQAEHLRVDRMARQAKNLARSLEIPVILLHQLNRPAKGTIPPEPHQADLREAGENHADLIILVHRPEEYDKDNPELHGVCKLIIPKHRGGETGSIQAHWDGPTMKTTGLSRRDQERGWA